MQFSASSDCFEARGDVFRAIWMHFRAFRASVGRCRELLEVIWKSDFGSKKSKILKSSRMAQNRSGMCLGSVWDHFGEIFGI